MPTTKKKTSRCSVQKLIISPPVKGGVKKRAISRNSFSNRKQKNINLKEFEKLRFRVILLLKLNFHERLTRKKQVFKDFFGAIVAAICKRNTINRKAFNILKM